MQLKPIPSKSFASHCCDPGVVSPLLRGQSHLSQPRNLHLCHCSCAPSLCSQIQQRVPQNKAMEGKIVLSVFFFSPIREISCVFVVLPELPSAGVGTLSMMKGSFIYLRSQILAMTNLFLYVLGHHWISEPQVTTELMCSCQEILRSSQILHGELCGFTSALSAAELAKSSLSPKH